MNDFFDILTALLAQTAAFGNLGGIYALKKKRIKSGWLNIAVFIGLEAAFTGFVIGKYFL